MRKLLLPFLPFLLALGCTPGAEAPQEAGQFTGTLASFPVKAITGPEKDKSLCYI